jgi:glycosyltransferase involved in cell wall biosynthesis
MNAIATDEQLSVSVLIATYNRDSTLCETMESVFSQDYRGKTELIVVDQSENHDEEVKKFLRAHQDDFQYIFQSKPNLPKARNAGFSAAKGQLVFFMDDDLILPPDAISRLAKHFRPFRLQVVSGLIISERHPELSLRRYAREHGIDVARQTRPKKVSRYIETARFLPAEAVRAVGGFDDLIGDLTPTAYGEDADFLRRLRLAKIPLFIDPTVRIMHKDLLTGGCASRSTHPDMARKYLMKSHAYMAAKYYGRVGLRAWLRLARGFVLNRQTLSRGLPYVRRCFLEARNAVEEVESFILANKSASTRSGATDVSPTSEAVPPNKVGI